MQLIACYCDLRRVSKSKSQGLCIQDLKAALSHTEAAQTPKKPCAPKTDMQDNSKAIAPDDPESNPARDEEDGAEAAAAVYTTSHQKAYSKPQLLIAFSMRTQGRAHTVES